jgi:hypothetical protein
MYEYFNTLINIGLTSYHVPFLLVIFMLFKKNEFSKYEVSLFFLVSYNALIILIDQLILDGHIDNYNPIYNIQTIIDFCTIVFIFSKILENTQQKLLNLLKYIIVIYLSISILELVFINDLFSINLISNNLAKFLIIIIALITIYLSEIKTTITTSQKIFTYTLLFYSITTFSISLFEEFIRLKVNYIFYTLWSINILLTICYNLFLTLSLWKLKR